MNPEDRRRLKDLVIETVSRHTGLPREKLRPTTVLGQNIGVNPSMHYRILLDIEHRLGINPLEGNWSFADGSIRSLIEYYVVILSSRRDTAQHSPDGSGSAGDEV